MDNLGILRWGKGLSTGGGGLQAERGTLPVMCWEGGGQGEESLYI